MTIAITGDKGYVGTALRKYFDDKGIDYIGFDIVDGLDIRNTNDLQQLSDVDVIIHLAALSGINECEENKDKANQVNIYGTRNIAELARYENIRVIFPSSYAAERDTFYGHTKREGEKIIEKTLHDYIIFKKSNIYGSYYYNDELIFKDGNVFPYFIKRAVNNETLTVHKPGTQMRDFINIKDIQNAYYKAVQSDAVGTFYLDSGQAISLLEFAELISIKENVDVELIEGPDEDEIFSIDSDGKIEEIEYESQVNISEGINEEIEKFRNHLT